MEFFFFFFCKIFIQCNVLHYPELNSATLLEKPILNRASAEGKPLTPKHLLKRSSWLQFYISTVHGKKIQKLDMCESAVGKKSASGLVLPLFVLECGSLVTNK